MCQEAQRGLATASVMLLEPGTHMSALHLFQPGRNSDNLVVRAAAADGRPASQWCARRAAPPPPGRGIERPSRRPAGPPV